MSRFGRQALQSALGEGVILGGSFAYGLLTARMLGPEGKGILGVLFASFGLLVTLCSLRFERAVVYTAAQSPGAVSRTVTSALVMGLLMLLCILVCLGTAPAPVLAYLFGGVPSDLVVAGAGFVPCIYLMLIISGLLAGTGRFGGRLLFWITVYAVKVSVAAVALIGMHARLQTFILVAAGAELLLYAGMLALMVRRRIWRPSWNWHHFRSMARYAASGVGDILGESALFTVPLLLLSLSRGSYDSGLFVVGAMMASSLASLANATKVVVLSRAAESSREAGEGRALRVLLLLELFIAIALILLGREVLTALYGDRFAGAFAPCLVLVPGVIASTVWGVLSAAVQGRGRPGLASLSTLAGSFCAAGCAALFIPPFGIMGAAAATSLAHVTCATTMLAIHAHVSGSPAGRLFVPEKREWKDLAGAVRLAWKTATVPGVRQPPADG